MDNSAVAPPSSTTLIGLSAQDRPLRCRGASVCVLLLLLLFNEGDLCLQFIHKKSLALFLHEKKNCHEAGLVVTPLPSVGSFPGIHRVVEPFKKVTPQEFISPGNQPRGGRIS